MTSLALLFIAASQSYNLPPGLLSALCWVESKHDISALNAHDGNSASLGLCQIKLGTARLLGYEGPERGLRVPSVNVHYSSAYLYYQLRRYNGDIRKAVSAYNAGTWSVNEHGKTKNKDYVSKVFKAWQENR